MKVVTQGRDEGRGIVKAARFRKTNGFAIFATVTGAVSEIEAFDGTRIGQMPPKAVEQGREFGFAENWMNVNFDHSLTATMFDNLSRDQ